MPELGYPLETANFSYDAKNGGNGTWAQNYIIIISVIFQNISTLSGGGLYFSQMNFYQLGLFDHSSLSSYLFHSNNATNQGNGVMATSSNLSIVLLQVWIDWWCHHLY